MKLRVLIVEDQVMFLELLVATLKMIPHIEVVATATSVQEAILAVERCKPDLAIIDLLLPGGSGLEVAQKAKELAPGIECLILTAQPGKVDWTPELSGYVRKIVDKVRAFDVLRREIDAILKENFPRLENEKPADPRALLTPREFELFQLIGQGHINKQIAAELFISQRTVESHRKAISRKLHSSGSDLVRMAALYGRREFTSAPAQRSENFSPPQYGDDLN